jgi:hypothetical protein
MVLIVVRGQRARDHSPLHRPNAERKARVPGLHGAFLAVRRAR